MCLVQPLSHCLLAATHSLHSGAARPIASARGPENTQMGKAYYYQPAPGTCIHQYSILSSDAAQVFHVFMNMQLGRINISGSNLSLAD